MHFNFHFLKFLCPQLNDVFTGQEIVTCFSQNKDELIIGCSHNGEGLYIRANLLPAISCISFPPQFKRSKRNTVSLFPEIIGKRIKRIEVVNFERAFVITFLSGEKLLFKLHGTRSNVLFFPTGELQPSILFRNELRDDKNILLNELEKKLVLDKETFIALDGNASKFLPTLGKIPREWLKAKGYPDAELDEKWELLQDLLDMLESPLFSIFKEQDEYLLTLLPIDNPVFQTAAPIDACNELFRYRVVIQAFEKEKQLFAKQLSEQLKRTKSYLLKTGEKLQQLYTEVPPSQIADIIMANLHLISPNQQEARLFNFYSGITETIKLKTGQSPQKYAENLYRKSKNRKKEISQLKQNIEEKEILKQQTEEWLEEIDLMTDFRSLREFVKANNLIPKSKEQEEQVPFKRFEVEGFEVLVGKSAKANDEMLRNFAWKEDMWLHAKDVSGSHVLVKYRSGIPFPKSVIERAAELAAYYSKNKSESLSPVIYTPAKFIRKKKGSAPGAVMVEKENVVIIKPSGPKSDPT